MKMTIGLILSGALLMVFGNACTGFSLESIGPAVDVDSNVTKIFQANGNGRSYDGKLIAYQSRDQVMCGATSTPSVLIEHDKTTGVFFINRTEADQNGTCRLNYSESLSSVDAFETSQLAAFEGRLHDRLLQPTEVVLNNSFTRVACKLDHGSFTLLDSQWTGVVIMETNEPQLWQSRLDFESRSPRTDFLYENAPKGRLYQSERSLEFRTDESSMHVRDTVVHLMHVLIQRPYTDALSPSLNFGHKVYPGKMQYAYIDQSPSSAGSISSNEIPVTCFVETIELGKLKTIDASTPYDFVSTLLRALTGT